jgi:tRNA (guanine-N7-)-methyltransferase
VNARLLRDGLGDRARAVCEDALLALPRLVPDGCVARAFIHFPDPWWKKRHHKRLLLVDPLVDQIARLLRDEGEIFVQTDVPDRAAQYAERIGAHAALEAAGDEPGKPALAANPYGAESNREKRCGADGLPVHRLRWRRRKR